MIDPAAAPGANIPVDTLPNLRDLGGYRNVEGKTVRRGQLYRSVLLGRLSDPDLEKIQSLGLKTVFDFRTADEFDATPDRDVGAKAINLNVMADRTGEGPASLLAKMGDPAALSAALDGGQAEEIMRTAYRELVELPSADQAYSTFFTTLADPSSLPALFHCTTGKDRTGWAAAVTLLFLGVSEEDVYHDYLQTNEQLLPALEPLLKPFISAGGDLEMLKPLLGVDSSYLATAVDLMNARYGSVEGYMRDGLDLDDQTLESLRGHLLAG